ncbi:MAG: FCD domain-containing protein [Casimicrobiaceae bacterium]
MRLTSALFGRPAIREALLMLQNVGLIETSSGERARVVRPSARRIINGFTTAAKLMLGDEEGVRGLQSARLLLEVALARYAARYATAADLERLAAALDKNKAAVGHPDVFMDTDLAFHFAIASIARNSIFTTLHEAMVVWLAEQRAVVLRNRAADAKAYEFHRQVFVAIAQHDADAAEAAMEQHLSRVAKLYWRQMRRRRAADETPGA